MSTSRQELDNFYKFASSYLDDADADLTVGELCELWQAGERGEPIREVLRESYERHGIVIDE